MSGISYGCLYNHATKITPSGNYHNGTVNGKSRRGNTQKSKHLLDYWEQKCIGARDFSYIVHCYQPKVNKKKRFLLSSRFQNSSLPGCQKKSKAAQLDQTLSLSASCISAPVQAPEIHPHLYQRGLACCMSCKQESKLQGMRAGTRAHSYSWPQYFLQEAAYFFI